MQLTGWGRAALVAAAMVLAAAVAGRARAQGVAEFDTAHSVYYEAPTKTHMFVYSPSVDVRASPWTWLDVSGGWQADVVSGASVATKAGSVYASNHSADVVTTASVRDFRNLAHGEVAIRGDTTSLLGGYAYGVEHDYRSNSLQVGSRTDAFHHNTQFELAYAHNFDQVCDRVQDSTAVQATWTALEDSTGCFTSNPARTTHDIAIDTFEASWAQSWTPVLETQLTYTAQLLDGFQSDPYRSVILGEGIKAQEHVPGDRARQAVTARVAYYLRAFKGALRLMFRGYRDTWDVNSGTVEAELEKNLGESFRAMLRGRLYKQTGALFWSDDYTGGSPPLGAKGQYWTGDRELSPFWSAAGSFRVVWTLAPQGRRVAGIFESLKLGASVTVTDFFYDEYTLAGAPVDHAISTMGTLSLEAVF